MSQDKATYEGMFLLDAGQPDFQAACEPIRTALERNEATILSLKPWDERRLAYEIQGRRRGLYVLVYFEAPTARITELERDCNLDERIFRILLLRKDGLTEEEINAETPATSGRKLSTQRDDEGGESDGGDRDEPRRPRPKPVVAVVEDDVAEEVADDDSDDDSDDDEVEAEDDDSDDEK